MNALSAWALNDRLSVIEAALLIINVNPINESDVLLKKASLQPTNFQPSFKALTRAIMAEDLKACSATPCMKNPLTKDYLIENSVDYRVTRCAEEDIIGKRQLHRVIYRVQ